MTKILIIDDEIDICKTIKISLDNKGYKVMYALTGKDGLDIAGAEKPNIVILDMCLGDMTGLEVLERIKAKDPLCCVIVMTGSYSEDNRRQALELGANYYLPKPFSIETLNNIISQL